jgi:site-specific recombinase XerD
VRRNKEIRDVADKGKPIMVEYTDKRGCKHRRAAPTLSNTTINKLLSTLAGILEVAVEYGHITVNPARGKRRRQRSATPRRSWLARAAHIEALLDGASKLDEKATVRRGQRRALLAVLVYGGLRISEALA